MSALVQTKTADNTGNVNNNTVTPTSGVTAGNAVALAIAYAEGSSRTIASVKDQANTNIPYTEIGSGLLDVSNGVGLRVIVIQNAPSGITGIKVTLSATASFGIYLQLCEFSGLKTSGLIDQSASQSQTAIGTGTDLVTSGNLTPGAQPGILFAASIDTSNAATPAAGTGFTSGAAHVFATQGRTEYKAISSLSAVAGTFTGTNGTRNFLTTAVMLLEPSGASVIPTGLHGGFSNMAGGFRG